jgi:hypothetical protein
VEGGGAPPARHIARVKVRTAGSCSRGYEGLSARLPSSARTA